MQISSPVFSTDGDTLGGRIGRAREAAGLSVRETANRLGVKRETVSAWENDRSEPRTNRLYMLAGILGVSPVWLISGAGAGISDPAPDQDRTALRIAFVELQRLHAETGRAMEQIRRMLDVTA